MKQNEINKISYLIGDYILDKFCENRVSIVEGLSILAFTIHNIIKSICEDENVNEDWEEMTTVFCNALQQPLKKKRHYSFGNVVDDEKIKAFVDELKSGTNSVEDIVDSYVDYKDSREREKIIFAVKSILDRHLLDNVEIGYEA